MKHRYLLLLEVEPDDVEEDEPTPTAETMETAVIMAVEHSTARDALSDALRATISLRVLDDRALDNMAHDILATGE